MNQFRPKVLISRCLGFDACRYNGQMLSDDFVEKLKSFVDFETVCPEVQIGLGIPRFPIRLVEVDDEVKLYQPSTDNYYTKEMNEFADSVISNLAHFHGVILKSASPSCGTNNVKIHSLKNGLTLKKGAGLFAMKIKKSCPNLLVEDEGRLKNYQIREHFLTALFTLFRFERVIYSQKIRDLVEFHAGHKYLLMAYNQKNMRLLGNLSANNGGLSVSEVISKYHDLLTQTVQNQPKRTNIINAILHIIGYFSKKMSHGEKRFFEETLEMYRDERIPLSSILLMLKGFAVRFEEEYILSQYILNPYPQELVELTDSGRHINM